VRLGKKRGGPVDAETGHADVGVGVCEGEVLMPPVPPKASEKAVEPPVLSETDKLTLAEIKGVGDVYGGFWTPNDIANMADPVLTADMFSLQWGILSELKKLNKNMELAIEKGSE